MFLTPFYVKIVCSLRKNVYIRLQFVQLKTKNQWKR